jgi:hypothetical protein
MITPQKCVKQRQKQKEQHGKDLKKRRRIIIMYL